MAAPSGTVWGAAKGGTSAYPTSYGRIGIYVKQTDSNTSTSIHVEVWFWSKYGVDDSYNKLYYNNLASSGSATTNVKSNIAVKTSVSSGEGWSTSNQVKLYEYDYTYTRGTSASTRYLYASFSGIDVAGSTMYAEKTFTVPKLASYTVSYHANGGSGTTPSSQTKYYGKNITIQKPTALSKVGHSFKEWNTKADGTGTSYDPGDTYSSNSGAALYAVWKANTYPVTFNANGGTGAPANQTKTYGVTLKLSTAIPTRDNYNFLGWGTSASATTVSYAAGSNYTANAATTLYAIWELAYVRPRITNVSVMRAGWTEVLDEEGNVETGEVLPRDDGEFMLLSFDWACDRTVKNYRVEWESSNGDSDYEEWSLSGTNGSITNAQIGLYDDPVNGPFSVESTYTIRITVTDEVDYTTVTTTLNGTTYAVDFLVENKGAAFGKPAELEGVLDSNWTIYPRQGFINLPLPKDANFNDYKTPNTYISYDKVASTYVNCPITSGTFTLEVTSAGNEGQVRQRVQYCSKTSSVVYERYYYGSNEDDALNWSDWYEAGGLKSSITVGLSANAVLGVVNEYTQIPFNKTILSLGYGLSLVDNSVSVGKGVRYVRISGQTKVTCGSTAGNRHIRLCKNHNGTISYLSWTTIKMEASQQDSLVFTPLIATVSEGDQLYMVFYTPDSSDSHTAGTSANGYTTYVTVESL